MGNAGWAWPKGRTHGARGTGAIRSGRGQAQGLQGARARPKGQAQVARLVTNSYMVRRNDQHEQIPDMNLI